MGTYGKNQKLVLVIDGLSSLDKRQNAMDLVWLPNNFPRNVKLVLSSSAGTTSSHWILQPEASRRLPVFGFFFQGCGAFSDISLGECLDALSRRDYPVLSLDPLEEGERLTFIRSYLKKISKKLTDSQVSTSPFVVCFLGR
jgi:hypothetical protein